MDALISAAARALSTGDTLGALKLVSLRDDPPALALRGIAMAQFGEYPRSRELLRRAARRFSEREDVARARCIVAEAEVALAMRDLRPVRMLAAAWAMLESRGDHANAQHARLIAVRRLLLLGRLEESAAALAELATDNLPPAQLAQAELVGAELALRRLHTGTARAALTRARSAAEAAGIAALVTEVDEAVGALDRPAARLVRAGHEQLLRLRDVEALFGSDTLVVDACRRGFQVCTHCISLARRPVLFALALALAEAWPGVVDRRTLITTVFRTRHADESHRARLRVEIARLRAIIAPLGGVEARSIGYALTVQDQRDVALLLPPIDGERASLLALLGDGEAWSSSALALALGVSQRKVQRALIELETTGQVRSTGRARSQRWLAQSLSGFATNLLLPGLVVPD